MAGVCIGVKESCTDAKGEYALPDMKEKLYMIDVAAGARREG